MINLEDLYAQIRIIFILLTGGDHKSNGKLIISFFTSHFFLDMSIRES